MSREGISPTEALLLPVLALAWSLYSLLVCLPWIALDTALERRK